MIPDDGGEACERRPSGAGGPAITTSAIAKRPSPLLPPPPPCLTSTFIHPTNRPFHLCASSEHLQTLNIAFISVTNSICLAQY